MCRHSCLPRGPKDQKNSRFRSRLKISIENEIFERATHRGPIFCGEIETSRLKSSSENQKFRSRLKISIEINFFWSLGPLGTWKKGLVTSNLQLLYRVTQTSPLHSLHLRGWQFAFWRQNLSWGCFIEKGGAPTRGVLRTGKKGSVCHFPCPLPASIWGHCSQVLAFTSI